MPDYETVQRPQEQRENLLERIRATVRDGKPDRLRATLSQVPAADLAEMLDAFEREEKVAVIEALRSELAGEVLTEVSHESLRELAETDLEAVADAVKTMEPDEVADVLEALPDEATRSVLSSLPTETAHTAEILLGYEPDTAGGIMTPEFVLLASNITAADAITITQRSRESETIAHLFVSDAEDRLVGHLPLHRLVFAHAGRTIGELMEKDLVTVQPDTDQEEVVRLATKYDLEVVPVVDARGRLLGVVTADDILEAAKQEADEDIYTLAGTAEVDPVHTAVRRSVLLRLPWLMLSLLDGLFIAFVARGFQNTLGIVEIALFIPLIPLMGGNVAVQSSTIIVRALAVGDLRRRTVGHFLARQAAVTGLLALGCGVTAGLLAGLWTEPRVMLVVGCAVALAIAVAGTLGMTLPFLFNRVGVDPAVSAGPFVTMLNDVFCITIYLSLASALL